MADVLTRDQRRRNMQRIKSKNTKPELLLRRWLFALGFRNYRIHYNLIGRPDLVFPKKRIAVFVDGCFWHKCPHCFFLPKTRRRFWENKINRNALRDRLIDSVLRENGWTVVRLWEHEIYQLERGRPPDVVLAKLLAIIR